MNLKLKYNKTLNLFKAHFIFLFGKYKKKFNFRLKKNLNLNYCYNYKLFKIKNIISTFKNYFFLLNSMLKNSRFLYNYINKFDIIYILFFNKGIHSNEIK